MSVSSPSLLTEQHHCRSERTDVVVRTFNSEKHLNDCLDSVLRYVPVHRLIVVDRHSSDDTVDIAKSHGAEIIYEDRGLTDATTSGIAACSTRLLLFVDSDVVICKDDFYDRAVTLLGRGSVGAVVGLPIDHRFAYGLPLGLTLFLRATLIDVPFPGGVQGRETYFIQKDFRTRGLKVRYVLDACRHYGTYRGVPHWPEWQGANVRISSGGAPIELFRSFGVVLLMHMNSKSPKNILYTPLFCTKLVRGYLSPARWAEMDRRKIGP